MNTALLSSTLLLTLLLSIGLFFFIRASTKDRTESLQFVAESDSEEALATQLQEYFTRRFYRTVAVDPEQKHVVYSGLIQPSVFLAVFLTLLAGIGLFCLALVLMTLFPHLGVACFGLILLCPMAGIYYWRYTAREEQVSLGIGHLTQDDKQKNRYLVSVTGHRDELLAMQRALPLRKEEQGAM